MGEKRVPGHFVTMLSRVRNSQSFTWLFKSNSFAPQGTKVLEDREIRHSFYWTSEDAPPQHASPGVVKYTGTLTAPEWEDIEPGIVSIFHL